MPLVGIGVGLPGFVDPVRGVLRASMPFEHYEEIEFVRDSRKALDLDVPILVDNDANCGCWGELAFKHSARPQNFLFVLGELRKHTIEMDDYRIMALDLAWSSTERSTMERTTRRESSGAFCTGQARSISFPSATSRPATFSRTRKWMH
jgi:hypothetical protein